MLTQRDKRGKRERAESLIREQGGIIRTSEALAIGIHPRILYQLRDSGVLDLVSRGVYRLADMPPLSNPDLVTVAIRIPRAVLCLVSALNFHEISTQVPHAISIALPKGTESPVLSHPPISIHRFSAETFAAGIEAHAVDGITLPVYSPEKTLADCFKFRNKIGMDVVLEALRLYRERKTLKIEELLAFARICRIENVMKPYLEAMV